MHKWPRHEVQKLERSYRVAEFVTSWRYHILRQLYNSLKAKTLWSLRHKTRRESKSSIKSKWVQSGSYTRICSNSFEVRMTKKLQEAVKMSHFLWFLTKRWLCTIRSTFLSKARLFLFYGLQIRRLYFKQIEIKIKSNFLDFFYFRLAKNVENRHFP